MYFLLSKLLICFLFPFNWVAALLVIAYFLKNKSYQYYTVITAVVVFLVFSNGYILNQFTANWDVKPVTLKPEQTYSCALILGGFVSEDENKHGYFNAAADRFIQAIKLKETGKVGHLLFTGGNASLNPDGFTEGNWLSSEVKAFHLPDSTFLFEKHSRNTIENIRFSKIILQSKHLPPPYLLVTSAFHMRRALLICKKEGLNVVAYPCNFSGGKRSISFDSFIPSAETLSGWNPYLKELVGYIITSFKSF